MKASRTSRRRKVARVVLLGALLASALMLAAAVVVLPSLRTAQVDRAKLDLENLGLALRLHHMKTDAVPTTAEGLKALVDSRILDAMPLDPWGNPYGYAESEGAVELRSLGADGAPGGTDDDEDIVLRIPRLPAPPEATRKSEAVP